MNEGGLGKLYWGFLFILLSFRIMGFDILPDVVGHILFAIGLSKLTKHSHYFIKAVKYNYPMIILSLFSIYELPVKDNNFNFDINNIYLLIISIVSIILRLIIFYNLFMGIKEMAERQGKLDIAQESYAMWDQYKILQIGLITSVVMILLPIIGVLYLLAIIIMSLVLVIKIMKFIKKCDENFNTLG